MTEQQFQVAMHLLSNVNRLESKEKLAKANYENVRASRLIFLNRLHQVLNAWNATNEQRQLLSSMIVFDDAEISI